MASRGHVHPEASLYRRNATRITEREVLHEREKQAQIADLPLHRRRGGRKQLEAHWAEEERQALEETKILIETIRSSIQELRGALDRLGELQIPGITGKVETELHRVKTALGHLDEAEAALVAREFGTAGGAIEEAERELWLSGGQFVVALNQVLQQAAVGKEHRQQLEMNLAQRREAKQELEAAVSGPSKLVAAALLRGLDAAGLALAAEVLAGQVRPEQGVRKAKIGRDGDIRVVPPQELETFSDVGGLEDVKEQLRSTVGAILERPEEAARYRVVHNGILFHGPPGTGKNLLSRALAGEYGMRYLRFSPATIASAYAHESAKNLRTLFELAKESAPCVLYLDEIDSIASARDDQPSAEHREVVTQLMVCLEEYRTAPGLVICAGTNNLDMLDPALREGRFDSKILLPLPDPESRQEIFKVHLERRGDAVDWDSVALEELARLTNGYNSAALDTVVSIASQTALRREAPIDQEVLVLAIKERGGKDRLHLDQPITWDDVVLPEDTREPLMEIVELFQNTELGASVGVQPPAGVLLHGPPGTGKTTIAKAMASEVQASFYEMSGADLLSKWVGESEQKVKKLFDKARANRPSIIFIDEIDALLRRRNADSTANWEDRVVSQFLRELDGLKGGEGVLLVGATNRLDVIDEAIVGRRLTPIEVGLPAEAQRLGLLQLAFEDVSLGKGVDFPGVAKRTHGMSGADIKRLRDGAARKALKRAIKAGQKDAVTVEAADLEASLEEWRQERAKSQTKVGRDGEVRVLHPQELETFEDIGGLEEVKEQLRGTIGMMLERPDEAARYRLVHNGILFHGPPGTGKNLLSRALAGEYDLRYLRFSPATIASGYIHEAAANLRKLFELASQNAPCVLFLDEIDTIASDRGDQPSADHREVVTQLMVCLEEYRSTPGLIIAAASNDLDRLDPALREGRFDAKIMVPLPDPEARSHIFRVHLERRGSAVDWDSLDLEELASQTKGYNAATVESVVTQGAQAAMRTGGLVTHDMLAAAIKERGGKHRLTLDDRITWDDVVLADATREQTLEILHVFSEPELARDLGVQPPAGLLLYGPPGTGKTTIAKAMASEVQASFYEMSGADMLSKWAGESEQKVAKLFEKARTNRPSLIFIDEIDALLRRRSADSSANWEERVVSQFLRELDGLKGGEGVLLVGATNRLDVIDEAIVGRRLTPIEVGLPDAIGRLQLLKLLTGEVRLAKGVNLRTLASETEGMSGADLRRLCNAAGMKALTRVAAAGTSAKGNGGGTKPKVAVTMADFRASLDSQRDHSSLVEV